MEIMYNLRYLEELAAGDNTFVDSMITDFITQTPNTLQAIETAIQNHNYAQIYFIVHRFIPTIEFIGADNIVNILRDIETLAKQNNNINNISINFSSAKILIFSLIEILKQDFNK